LNAKFPKFLLLVSFTFMLFGCGLSETITGYESGYRCMKAAVALDNDTAARNIENYIEDQPYASDVNWFEDMEIRKMTEEVNSEYDDLYHEGYKGLFYPLKVHNSDRCLDMHGQEKMTVSDMGLPELTVIYYGIYIFI